MTKYKPSKIIKDKIDKKEHTIRFWKLFSIEGGLFFLTSLSTIIGAFELNRLAQIKKVYLPTTSLQDFIFSFLFITFFILLFILYKKAGKFKGIVFKGLFMITVFWGGMTILSLFLPVFGAILIMGSLIVLWLEFPTVWVHDILMILGLSGASSFFGLSFTPSVVVALLLIFSVYDFVAVYKTKHMVLMAKEMIINKVILGFIIPKNVRYFKDKLSQVKPGGDFMILGGGDVVFPCLLAVSVIPGGFLRALIVVLFSSIGLLFSYWLFAAQKGPKGQPGPIPALPPIALFSVIGYFITLFIW